MNNKKIKTISLLLIMMALMGLTACGGNNTAIGAVRNLYTAASKNDTNTINQSMEYCKRYDKSDTSDLTSTLLDSIKSNGGVKKISLQIVIKSRLSAEAMKAYNSEYEDTNWVMVSQKAVKNDEALVWILKKMDGKYYIYDILPMDVSKLLK